jgi:hypothetical protein
MYHRKKKNPSLIEKGFSWGMFYFDKWEGI